MYIVKIRMILYLNYEYCEYYEFKNENYLESKNDIDLESFFEKDLKKLFRIPFQKNKEDFLRIVSKFDMNKVLLYKKNEMGFDNFIENWINLEENMKIHIDLFKSYVYKKNCHTLHNVKYQTGINNVFEFDSNKNIINTYRKYFYYYCKNFSEKDWLKIPEVIQAKRLKKLNNLN